MNGKAQEVREGTVRTTMAKVMVEWPRLRRSGVAEASRVRNSRWRSRAARSLLRTGLVCRSPRWCCAMVGDRLESSLSSEDGRGGEGSIVVRRV